MDNSDEKEEYFKSRDKWMNSLPEPEKSIYKYFRLVEKSNLNMHGRLIVDGKSPVQTTAEHFKLTEAEVRKVCLHAVHLLKAYSQNS